MTAGIPAAANAAMSFSKAGLEGLRHLPLGTLRSKPADVIEDDGEPRVHRLLDPQRAVIIEQRNAVGDAYVLRASLRRRAVGEINDRGFCSAIIP
jgi:hypothetical protein